MKLSRNIKNKLLSKNNTVFKIKDVLYKKDKDIFVFKDNWVQIKCMPTNHIDDYEIVDCINPYTYAFYRTDLKKYFQIYTREIIEDIKIEWLGNFHKTLKQAQSFYLSYVKDFNNNAIKDNLEIHKINFITNEVKEIYDDSYIKPIYQIQQIKENLPSYIKDHYCRNYNDTFYMIYIKQASKEAFELIKKDKMFDLDKLHNNSSGLFIKSYKEPSEEELFYLKLIHSDLKYQIFKCYNRNIELQS